ncbi:LuxE/PaaK family acyltransferase [Bacillus sp. USDA818B3_A]|uniref:LuxE/PaaK family acyltransferase n=1 Tax=Bacillus sp. USDA818B3_A TaxID=2698834 RepID=UPI00136F435D|nr:CoF synthetase [Bacillus sp. USDA818B3_A]
MRETSKEITNQILKFIETYKQPMTSENEYEQDFNTIALQLFRYQFQHNLPFKKFCQTSKKTPLTVKHWEQIPPMPIQGFKYLTLSCEPVEEANVFMTSGTTNPELKGKNYHPTFSVWDTSMKEPFKQYVLPDLERIKIFVLSPAEDMNQNSSLSRYLSNAVSFFGTKESRFFFGQEGLRLDEFAEALKESENSGEPLMLMGATFSYVHVLDYLKEKGIKVSLPKGSRIFDTGGFKGKSREVEQENLYNMFREIFQVERNGIINMYGMTELSSQIYDQTIRSAFLENKVIHDKKGPLWVQTRVLNTDTLEPVPEGEVGVLAHYDLANWNSCLGILTEDIGYKTEFGFVLLGRVKGSEARGCSIAVDQLLQSNLGGANH